jgi:hypothetical protein
MSSVIVFNGISYTIPDTNDVSWGASVTAYLKAIPGGVLAKTGGAWHLTAADLDLGATYGVASPYFKSKTASISASGVLRLALTDLITWRKDGSSDYRLGVGSNGFATWETIDLVDVSSAQVLSNKVIDAGLNTITNLTTLNLSPAAGIAYSQLAINPGEIPYTALTLLGQITNADISPTANIDGSKVNTNFGPSTIITAGGLKLGTTNFVTLNADPSADYDFTFPDADGVDGQALVRQSGELVWASIPGLSLPHYNITVGDGSSLPQATDTSALGDVLADDTTGLTIKSSAIVNDMVSLTAGIEFAKMEALTADRALQTNAFGVAEVSATTAAELGYLSGVTSDIQTQINAISDPSQWKKVAIDNAPYTSIQDAIDAILDASSVKPYVVEVYPGVYAEEIVLKDWVFIQGVDPNGCILFSTTAPVTGAISPGARSGIDGLVILHRPNTVADLSAIDVTGDTLFSRLVVDIETGAAYNGTLAGIKSSSTSITSISSISMNLRASVGTIVEFCGYKFSGTQAISFYQSSLYALVAVSSGLLQGCCLSNTGDILARELNMIIQSFHPAYSGTVVGYNCSSAASSASVVRLIQASSSILRGAGTGTAYASNLDSTGNTAKLRFDGMSAHINGFANEYIANTGTTDSQALWITSLNKDLPQDAAGLSVSTPQDQNTSGFVRWGGAGAYWSYVVGTRVFTLLRSGAGVVRSTPITWAANQTVTLTNLATNYVYVTSTGVLASTTSSSDIIYTNNIVLFQVWSDGTYYQVTKENHPYEYTTAVSKWAHKTFGPLITGLGATITQLGATSARTLAIVGDDTVIDHGLESTITGDPATAATWYTFYTNASGKMAQDGAGATAIASRYNNAGTAANASNGQRIVKRLGVIKDSLNSASPIFVAVLHTTTYGSDTAALTAISSGNIVAFPAELKALEVVQIGFIVINANGSGAGTIINNGVVVSKQAFGASLIGASASNQASLITTTTTNFNRALSGADTTVQAALDTIDDTMVTPTTTDTLTNKYYDCGTASATNKLKLPSDTYANLVALAGKAEGQLYYATDLDKVYYFDGSVLKVTGGGLLTVYKAYADGDFTAEAGKHYIVDMAGAAALRTITLPTGAAEAVVRVTCINNDSTTYPLTIARDGSSTIFYNDTENTTVSFPYAEQWAEFSYTVTGTHWVVNDGSTPLSGTWSGSLDMTGTLYVDTIQEHTATKGVAIKGRTDGVEVAAGYVGNMSLPGLSAQVVVGKGVVYNVASSNAIPASPGSIISVTLNKGVYLLSAHMLGGSSSGGFSAGYYWVLGTTRATSIYNVDAVAGAQVALPIPMLPVTITDDNTVVAIYGDLNAGVSAYNLQEIFGVRIA